MASLIQLDDAINEVEDIIDMELKLWLTKRFGQVPVGIWHIVADVDNRTNNKVRPAVFPSPFVGTRKKKR